MQNHRIILTPMRFSGVLMRGDTTEHLRYEVGGLARGVLTQGRVVCYS